MPKDENINMLIFFLAYEATGKENVKVVNYASSDTDWYCFGIAVPERLDEFFTPTENDWGNWPFGVILAYWLKDGLVTYEYKPAMPVL